MKKLIQIIIVSLIVLQQISCQTKSDQLMEDAIILFENDHNWVSNSITFHEDVLYYGTWENDLYAVDFKTREVLWSIELEDVLLRKVIFTNRGLLIVLNTGDVSLFDYDGKQLNKLNLGGRIKTDPLIYGDDVIISVRGKGITRLDLSSFTISVFLPSTEQLTTTQPVIKNDFLLVGDLNDQILCYDLREEELRWSYSTERSLQSNLVLSDSSVYVAVMKTLSQETQLVRLSFETGHLIRSSKSEVDIRRNPVVYNNNLIFSSSHGVIKAFDKQELTDSWSVDAGYFPSTEFLVSDNMIFFGTTNFKLFSLQDGEIVETISLDHGLGNPFLLEGKVTLPYGNKLIALNR